MSREHANIVKEFDGKKLIAEYLVSYMGECWKYDRCFSVS